MKFEIHHIKQEHRRDYGFEGIESLKALDAPVLRSNDELDQVTVNLDYFEKVYENRPEVIGIDKDLTLGTFAAEVLEVLEELFYRFNENRPADYQKRSMSVGDLVCIHIDNHPIPAWYFCDSFGWKRISAYSFAERNTELKARLEQRKAERAAANEVP